MWEKYLIAAATHAEVWNCYPNVNVNDANKALADMNAAYAAYVASL